ncbi:MAG: hypothetical protein QOC92_3712 [Acidimicrobiaceae bacterium]|jgi:hypothetical protein
MVASAPAPATANVIRPAANDHVAGARPADIALDELVAVSDVLEPPARPVIQTVMTVAMVVLLIVLALSGIGGVDRTKVLLPGQATVAGVDPASGATVKIDFSKPVQVVLPQPPPDVAKVRLEFSVAGVALPSSATEPLVSFNNTPVANLAVSSVRYLIAGGFGASLVMLNADGKTIAHHDFAAARDGSGIATVPGAVSILLLLFVFATAESFLRPLRKSGKRKVSAVLGMAFIGAVFGVAVSLLAWVFASVEITAVSVVACAMVGLLAGVMMAITVAQYGRRRRAKRVLAQRAGRRVARAA